MPLSDIVNVVITRQTQTVTEQGFGTPLILGTSNHFTDLIRFYSSMDEVALDFSPNDPEYIAAQDIFSQTISPERIAIGRRQVDTVQILVETAMPNEDYVIVANGDEVVVPATSSTTYSVATLNADLVPNNRIAVSVDGTGIGTTTAIIDFDSDFVASNSIVPRINNVNMTAIPFTTDQATTLANVRAAIAANAAVTGGGSATVTGARQITVVFNAAGTNIVNSVITTGGASQPTASIVQGGFAFTTNTATTLQNIANAIESTYPTLSATVSAAPARILTVQGPDNTTATINSFVVTGGATQATATIANLPQSISADSLATQIAAAINAEITPNPAWPVTATAAGSIVTLSNRTPGVPYTLAVRTTIGNPNAARVRITQVSPNQIYTATINGIDFSFRSPNNIQTSAQIASALTDIINAVPVAGEPGVPVTATNNGDGSFELVSDNDINSFSISVTPEVMSVQKGLIVLPLVPVNTVTTDLDLINNSDSSWYALILIDRQIAVVKAAAAWIETRIKLFGTASSDTNIINSPAGVDTTSIAAFLNQNGYVRTFVMYHQDSDFDYPEAAWFGRVLPLEPGSETWKFKTLNGISYSNLTTTQSNNAFNKKANTYEFVAGVGITANGTVAQGEYIDTVRGIDWLTARIQEFVFSVLVNNPKVPYTDAGIAVIQAEVLRVLQLGISNNFIATDPEPICTVPLAADIPPADKAARILRGVRFFATLAGAIHAVRIQGTVSV